MMITRHYLTINGRRVHYRKAGNGPPVLMIHQSPRSSAEYDAVMRIWGERFTCIAPDSPGFGQSDPLPMEKPGTADFADAIVAFADAVGFKGIAAYGFHSGGIFLMNAIRRYPEKFVSLGAGGYPCFREEELADVGEDYLPPLIVAGYGEHLVWAWNRMLEQTWYFPWFKPEEARRLPNPHADPALVHDMVVDLLVAGDAYRDGYRAALTASFDVPLSSISAPPALLSSYAGDPMAAHMMRFPPLPNGWTTQEQKDSAAHFQANADFFQQHPAPMFLPAEDSEAGFLSVRTSEFDGLIHWHGKAVSGHLLVHGPGREAELVDDADALRIDLPGHGLSDRWPGTAPSQWQPWQAVIDAVVAHFGIQSVSHEALPAGAPDLLYPDLTPDRFGGYLTKAWAIVRAGHVFSPGYAANAANSIPINSAALAPQQLAREHLALIRSTAAKALHIARQTQSEV